MLSQLQSWTIVVSLFYLQIIEHARHVVFETVRSTFAIMLWKVNILDEIETGSCCYIIIISRQYNFTCFYHMYLSLEISNSVRLRSIHTRLSWKGIQQGYIIILFIIFVWSHLNMRSLFIKLLAIWLEK
jgi:hypothetical protein